LNYRQQNKSCLSVLVIRTFGEIIILIDMNQGTVKFFNDSKGYGFIKDTETGIDYFVHISGLIDEVRESDDVSFDLQEGRKGLNAINVKLI